jgi:hypothetical protein
MTNTKFFDTFSWHSAIGIDAACLEEKKAKDDRIPNSIEARGRFFKAGESLLIHKATRALWKLSDDGKFIEPVYDDDILGEDPT